MQEIEASIREQWGDKKPLRHPAIAMYFSMASERSDRDNSFTTILDALVKCGVLEDDRITSSNGTYIVTPGVVDKEAPFTLVWLQPDGNVAPLIAKLEQLAAVAQMPRTMMLKRRSRWRR